MDASPCGRHIRRSLPPSTLLGEVEAPRRPRARLWFLGMVVVKWNDRENRHHCSVEFEGHVELAPLGRRRVVELAHALHEREGHTNFVGHRVRRSGIIGAGGAKTLGSGGCWLVGAALTEASCGSSPPL